MNNLSTEEIVRYADRLDDYFHITIDVDKAIFIDFANKITGAISFDAILIGNYDNFPLYKALSKNKEIKMLSIGTLHDMQSFLEKDYYAHKISLIAVSKTFVTHSITTRKQYENLHLFTLDEILDFIDSIISSEILDTI